MMAYGDHSDGIVGPFDGVPVVSAMYEAGALHRYGGIFAPEYEK